MLVVPGFGAILQLITLPVRVPTMNLKKRGFKYFIYFKKLTLFYSRRHGGLKGQTGDTLPDQELSLRSGDVPDVPPLDHSVLSPREQLVSCLTQPTDNVIIIVLK